MAGVTGLGVFLPGFMSQHIVLGLPVCLRALPVVEALSFRALDSHIANPSNPTDVGYFGVSTIFLGVTLGALGFG